MIILDNVKNEAQGYVEPLNELAASLHLEDNEKRIEELQMDMESPGFWDNPDRANKLTIELKSLQSVKETVDKLKQRLETCRSQHEKLENEIRSELSRFNEDGKKPNPMAKGMSWIKTNAKLATTMDSDETIADLMTDGCNMGVKSLHRYLNQYSGADDRSRDITKRLINLEEGLAVDIRSYL